MKRKPLTRKEHDRMRELQKVPLFKLRSHYETEELQNLQTRHKLYGDVPPEVLADILRF